MSGKVILTNSRAYLETKGGPFDNVTISMDDLERERPRHVYMMVIQHCFHSENAHTEEDDGKSSGPSEEDCLEGLFLIAKSGTVDVYSRVGMFEVHESESCKTVMQEHKAAELKVITLV